MADTQPARVFRFGPFEADLRNRQLLENGAPVSLQGQPFDVLALLLEHPGQLVTRDQLRARLWPSGTVVEFDHSIHAAVTKLREVLGEQADHPRFIATVPRHGYRFIAPVSTPAPTALELATVHSQPFAPQASAQAVSPPRRRLDRAIIAVLAVGVAYVVVDRFWNSRPSVVVQPAASTQPPASRDAATGTVAAFNPPPHSIAVLPFANLSGDSKQEYFSDGLTEELLTALTHINELQVAAQTSSFYFKGKDADLSTIAHKLNVGAVLEGSVRRSGQSVRITAQLIDSTTGFHLWSQTYDRTLGDILSLQTEIANAVANSLKVTLLDDTAAKIELGGTRDAAALDAYLRGLKGYSAFHPSSALDAYTEAIRLDPNYARAFAARSVAHAESTNCCESSVRRRTGYGMAFDDARRAIALAPALGEAHLALAYVFESTLDFEQAAQEYARALALVPGSATALYLYGAFAVDMGRTEPGLSALSRAVVLDPLSPRSHQYLGEARWIARRYREAVTAFDEVLSIDPDNARAYRFRGFAYYGLGDLQRAFASCPNIRILYHYECLALTYEKLGKHAEAEANLAKYQDAAGDASAYQYAQIYAQWGDVAKALQWLETALRARDPGLGWLKGDPLLDPLRQEPRFQAIERELKFPD
jgi:TolB-like protein/DNA-binding winged helix-turn-helix (wHTH) protein/Flp pilus assembly protein TadD